MADALPRFECGHCSEAFARQEHLSRHMARHSGRKPFQCQHCARSFPRRDTLKRHITTHGPHALRSYHALLASTGAQRVKACLNCAQVKKRCSGTAPCRRCNLKSMRCEFPDSEPRPCMRTDPQVTSLDLTASSNQIPLIPITPETSPEVSHPFPTQAHDRANEQQVSPEQLTLDALMSNTPDLAEAAGSGLFDPQLFSGLDFPFNWGFPEDNTPYQSDAFLTCLPATQMPSTNLSYPPDAPNLTTAPDASFAPEPQDDLDALLAEDFGHVRTLSEDAYQRAKSLSELSGTSQRDKSRSAFPTRTALNALTQLFFEYFAREFPLIHTPTFDPNTVPELVVVTVAAVGVNYTGSNRKDQYRNCLMETLEESIHAQLPRTPSFRVDFSLVECVLLYNICLMFSGSHRELLKLQYDRNILVTLYRQARMLGRHGSLQRGELVEGANDEERWRTWVMRERERRVLHGVWLLECLHRIFLDHQPLLSLAELSVPLPAADNIWEALDARVWKSLWRENPTPSLSSLFSASQPTTTALQTLGEFSKTLAMVTFFVEEQRILDSNRSWISRRKKSAPPTHPTTLDTTTAAAYEYEDNNDDDDDDDDDDPFLTLTAPEPSPISATTTPQLRTRLAHLLPLLRAVKLRTLHAFSGWRATDAEVAAATASLRAWLAHPRNRAARARRGVVHAGALVGAIRDQRKSGMGMGLPFDPFVLLVAVLYLWAWQALSPDLDDDDEEEERQGQGQGQGRGRGRGQRALRIDERLVDEEGAEAWVQGRVERAVRVEGVGELGRGEGARRRLLKEFGRILLAQGAWTPFQRWLAECAARLVRGEKPRDQGGRGNIE